MSVKAAPAPEPCPKCGKPWEHVSGVTEIEVRVPGKSLFEPAKVEKRPFYVESKRCSHCGRAVVLERRDLFEELRQMLRSKQW